MAVIFYGVQGEGLGHATRSKSVIEHLSKKNEVYIFCGGKAYQYMTKHFKNIYRITSPHIFYKKNRASNLRTFVLNLIKVPSFFYSYKIVCDAFKEKKPDIIITDFEPITSYFALFNKVPIISLDNQHLISKTEILFSPSKKWQYLKTKLIVKLMIWKADRYFIVNFFFPEVKESDAKIFKPLIREEFQKLRPKRKNFVIVYQTSFTDTNLVSSLIETGEKMVVYGYSKPSIMENVEFREFNEHDFFENMKNCKAIITNGGQSLMCEAIFLKKPVLSVPVKNQFEQYVNAEYLQKLGYGEYHEKIDAERIRAFLSRLSVYEKNLSKTRMIGNKDVFRELDRAIKELSLNRKVSEQKS